jgi:VWFA-related protein
MRRLILLALLSAAVLPAGAARRLTVAQLEQALTSEIKSHADAEVARHIGEFELSERLTEVTLGRFAAKVTMGPRTALALQLLADQSAFLDPPADEMPATGTPDAATQERMMDAARGYVVQAWPHLPNFFVTRTTSRFDDGPHVLEPGGWPVRAGLQLAGTTSRQTAFRDGQEIQEPVTETAAIATGATQPQTETGLYSFGEFGPELTVVLTDTAKGKVTWSHWEQTTAGLAAVYHYSVPKAVSHYEVRYCCLRDSSFVERRALTFGSRSQSPQQMANLPKTEDLRTLIETPGYHGSLFIDPSTGAILRITLEAELKEDDPITRAATVVQYGPVLIGNQRFICPVRSLAFSMQEPLFNGNGQPRGSPILLVNETSFSHYHRLTATIRMLADGADTATQSQTPPGPGQQNPPASSSASAGSAPQAANSPDAGTQMAAVAPPATPGTANNEAPAPIPTEPPSPPPPPATPEFTVNAANGVPDLPSDTAQAQEATPSFKLTTRLVDVGIIVYDKKGHPVKDLKPEDFEVFDNGRKQEIRFFSQYAGEPMAVASASWNAAGTAAPSAPEQSFSNRSRDPAGLATPAAAPETSTTILLIDESHIAWNDMNNAKRQVLKFLGQVGPTEPVGFYTMTALGFRVVQEITTDHAALIAKLQKWMPTAQSVSQAQDEEMRNRQQFNEVHNVADLNSVNGNLNDVPDAEQPVDPQLLTMGDNPARASLIILGGVARHLSAVPGHKTLVWISSDNVFADFRDQAVGIDKSSKYVDSFALHAQEAMNDAHVAVFPFDVSMLEGEAITADMQHRNVELNQAAMDTATASSYSVNVARNGTAGRIAAEMNQDLHPIQGPIRQVAEATGGRTIRRSGDLAGELSSIVAEGHDTYQISFHPDMPADGQYHAITVKLTGKNHGLNPHYRTGYLYAKEATTLKERFQQAVWRPMDTNEISVTASVGAASPGSDSGAGLKLTIAASDLGMEQRAGLWMDKLDIFFIQRDDAGIRARVEGQTLGLRLKPATYQSLLSSGIPFEHSITPKRSTASLRVLVIDENSGRMGSVTIPVSALAGAK